LSLKKGGIENGVEKVETQDGIQKGWKEDSTHQHMALLVLQLIHGVDSRSLCRYFPLKGSD